MVRFGFNIKTRTGQKVDNISIMAGSQADAERRLRQMYLQCEIIECVTQSVPRRVDTLDVEGIIGLISASEPAVRGLAAANDPPSTRPRSGRRALVRPAPFRRPAARPATRSRRTAPAHSTNPAATSSSTSDW